MKKINNFKYEDNGIVIVFTAAPKNEDSDVQKYSFYVEGDPVLTEKLINSVKTKKVKIKEIYFCANSLFQKIKESAGIKQIALKRNILISSSSSKRGSEGEEYYRINLIHQRGVLTKSFTLYGGCPFGTRDDWEDIFFSGEGEQYKEFLKQFDVEMPDIFLSDSFTKVDIENFSTNFQFK